jgi:hypothetical protein
VFLLSASAADCSAGVEDGVRHIPILIGPVVSLHRESGRASWIEDKLRVAAKKY